MVENNMEYESPPQNDLVRPTAFLALLVLAAWNVAGWMGSEAPIALRLFLAAFTLTFEILCFNVSAQKARADERTTSNAVRRFWFWALIMCCGWSMFSAHHALILFTPEMTHVQRAPAYVVLALAACIIPLLPWAIERTERAPAKRPDPRTDENTLPPLDERPARNSPGPRRTKSAGRPYLRDVSKAALAVGAAATPIGAHSVAASTQVADPGDHIWRAQARDLWVGGLTNKAEIARRVGRPRETVRRELAALGG